MILPAILIAARATGRLGGGGAPDISIGRVLAAFAICALIALLAVLLIRQRMGRGDLGDLLRRAAPGRGALQVAEVRRLTMHADLGLVRHDGREYLLVLQAGSATVLRERDVLMDGAEIR